MKAYVLCILTVLCFIVGSNATDIHYLREFEDENIGLEIGSINADENEFIVQAGRGDRDNFKCPYEYGAFPDPRDCSSFYVCKNGRSTHKKCQRNMLFDIHRRTCLPRWLAVCGDGKEVYSTRNPRPTPRAGSTTLSNDGDFKCNSLYGTYPHPTKCDKYYTCIIFKATLLTCPKSQLFDVAKKQCMSEDKVNCGNRERPFVFKTTKVEPSPTPENFSTLEETESTEPDIETTFSESPSETPKAEEPTTTEMETEEPTTTEVETEEPTTTEIETEEPTTTEIETEEPTTTEIETEEPTTTATPTEETTTTRPTGPPETDCDEDDVDCIITETGEVSDWFVCPEDMGAYEHPSSNKLFIFCLNWKPSVKRCGQDLIFSTKLATCVQPETDDDLSSE